MGEFGVLFANKDPFDALCEKWNSPEIFNLIEQWEHLEDR